jgi:hypothetical protein
LMYFLKNIIIVGEGCVIIFVCDLDPTMDPTKF